ncbi:hypothetical protein N8T08_009710 [Aspergillus melleus]|uniref:Uncharacterized protein n=1 Tax=Aspergillus melleus TaxID=138277 RepID=A0ACC3ATM9_9EURO|nr:hypothetical protein N8T08_009710 [Aspergillus melleus]
MKVDYYQNHERHERHREYCRARWQNANPRIRQRGFEPPYPPGGRPLPEMPSFAVWITLDVFNLLILRYGDRLSFPALCAVLHIVNYIKRKTYKRYHANNVIPPLEKPVVAPPPEIPSDNSAKDTMNKIEVEFNAIHEEPADQAEKLAGRLDKHTTETEIQSMNEVVIDPAGDVTIVVFPPEKAPAYAPGAGTTATTQPQRFRVSSHKLIAGSKFFETLLTIPGSESEGLRVDGTTVLRIPDTDPSMFTILLVLLYSPPCEVAQPMILESITLLAVQAYYFQCEKVLQHPSAQRPLHRRTTLQKHDGSARALRGLDVSERGEV